MNNRGRLIDRLKTVTKDLGGELNYFMNSVEHEGDYDLADAFEDAGNSAEENGGKDSYWKEIKQIYIELGFVEPVDIKKVQVSRGKRYWFKVRGVHYDCISSWEQWINE